MAQRLVPFIDEKMQKHEGIYLDLDSEMLWYVKRHRGKLVKFSSGEPRSRLQAAKRVINEKLPFYLNQPAKKRKAVVYNRDEITRYIKAKEASDLDETTKRRIRSTFKNKIRPYWDDLLVIDFTQDNVDDWIAWYKEQWPSETMDNAVKYVRAFTRELHRLGLITVRPIVKDPNQKRTLILRTRKTERIFTPEERAHVLDVAIDDEKLSGLFMATMAARIEETLSLSFDEQIILIDRPLYRWQAGQNKADHSGEHYLHDSLVAPMLERYEHSKELGTKRVFPQKHNHHAALKPQQIDWDGWRKRADLGWHWTSKTFRHTLLTELFNNPALPQLPLCKQYRISPQVAFKTYVKTTDETMKLLSRAVKV